MPRCVAWKCSVKSGEGIVMHRFPKDKRRHREWERSDWTPHPMTNFFYAIHCECLAKMPFPRVKVPMSHLVASSPNEIVAIYGLYFAREIQLWTNFLSRDPLTNFANVAERIEKYNEKGIFPSPSFIGEDIYFYKVMQSNALTRSTVSGYSSDLLKKTHQYRISSNTGTEDIPYISQVHKEIRFLIVSTNSSTLQHNLYQQRLKLYQTSSSDVSDASRSPDSGLHAVSVNGTSSQQQFSEHKIMVNFQKFKDTFDSMHESLKTSIGQLKHDVDRFANSRSIEYIRTSSDLFDPVNIKYSTLRDTEDWYSAKDNFYNT
ncbi:hypothetical protein LOTGIDRAFT_164629 [Lottia gigantea]|uniref:Uncharacterized protein n=1 Tax=Lottia gigantea TaxID=225164 RepID=V3ZZX3_LOTGI|nr:hypothetical protein LOTGIDRAFT_164629 [Lottia gigantea]ESO89932.1 hypothetical protein LOTGIDRAFT_164629 [Lottia gigantea]